MSFVQNHTNDKHPPENYPHVSTSGQLPSGQPPRINTPSNRTRIVSPTAEYLVPTTSFTGKTFTTPVVKQYDRQGTHCKEGLLRGYYLHLRVPPVGNCPEVIVLWRVVRE